MATDLSEASTPNSPTGSDATEEPARDEQLDPAEAAPVTTPSTGADPPTTEPLADPTPVERSPECLLETNGAGEQRALDLSVEVVASGLEVPWGLAVLPSGDLLVTERPGRLRLVTDGELLPTPVLEFEISELEPLFGIDTLGFEGGLLGLLLHPDFETNRQFYIFSNVANTNGEDIGRVERYVLSGDGERAQFDTVIIDDLPTGLHHQGGRMRLGPDDMLYVTVGAYEPEEAQDPTSLAGKLLRMDLEGSIPPDNPNPDSYVYVSGIRNSQGYDWFDDEHIVMVDHGPSGLELNMPELRGLDEVNVARAGTNLGWPEIWGCDQQSGLSAPVLTFGAAVPPTDGVFYRHDRIAEFTDSFLYTTVGRLPGRHLHRVEFADGEPYAVATHDVHLTDEFGRLRTVVVANDGTLYVMTSNCDNRGFCPPEGDLILRIG